MCIRTIAGFLGYDKIVSSWASVREHPPPSGTRLPNLGRKVLQVDTTILV